jgi:superfamily II DNA or RNA helicase
MPCLITIEGTQSKLSGEYPKDIVSNVSGFFVQGHEYSEKFLYGGWDGRISLFNKKTGVFPTGLVSIIHSALTLEGFEVVIKDNRVVPEHDNIKAKDATLAGVEFKYPFDFQVEAAQAFIDAGSGILSVATNGGKSTIAALIIKCLHVPTLFMVPNLELLHQTRRVLKQRLDLNDKEVGIVGDKSWKPGRLATVATTATLYSRIAKKECQDLLNSVQLLILDESHHEASDSWHKVTVKCPAYYRLGMSGSALKRSDGADLKLIATTGDVVYSVTNKDLIERGVSIRPHIHFLKVTEPKIKKWTKWQQVVVQGISENVTRNSQLIEKTMEYVDQDLQALVLVDRIEHGNLLKKMFEDKKVDCEFTSGKEEKDFRIKVLDRFRQGKIKVLVSSPILNEGVDLSCIDVLTLAGGGKSSIRTLQRIGRGLRKGKNKTILHVIDTIDNTHKYLLEHSLKRLEDYKAEDCFLIDLC